MNSQSQDSNDSKAFAGKILQDTLIELESFCSKWRIGLNANKTKCLIFKKKNKFTTPNIYLQNELLGYEKKVKFLGIIFDEKLSFKEHIEEIYERC